MNIESKVVPQAETKQQSPEINSGKNAQSETANTPSSSNRRREWKVLFKRIGIAGAAATAAVTLGVGATEANAGTQEKPTTSISQTEKVKSEDKETTYFTGDDISDTITGKNGEVVRVDHNGEGVSGYTLSKVDDDTVNIVGSGEPHNAITPEDSTQKGVEKLVSLGMNIKNVKELKNSKDNASLQVNVDNAGKLNRSQRDKFDETTYFTGDDISDTITEKNGEVVRVDHDGEGVSGYTLSKVDDDTVNIVGSGEPHNAITSEDSTQKGVEKLASLGMNIKNREAIETPGNEDGHILKVDVDDANKLDKIK